MARGGRVICRKAPIRRRRRSDGGGGGGDDDDEEYVLEEEEEEASESNYESDVNSLDFDDESLESSESEAEITRSKKKSRDSGGRIGKRGTERPRRQESRVSDEDDEGFSPDEDDFDLDKVSAFENFSKKRRSKVSEGKGNKKGGRIAFPGRKRQKRVMEKKSDVDFVWKDRVSSKKGREMRSSDYVVSDDDFVEKGLVVVCNRGTNGKNVKGTAGNKERRKKRSSEDSDSDFVVSEYENGDHDFDVKHHVVVDKREKKSKKMRKNRSLDLYDGDFIEDFVAIGDHGKDSKKVNKTAGSKGRGRTKEDSDASDSDFAISDDGGDDDEAGSKGRRRRRRRRRIEENSDASDSDFAISDDGGDDDDDFVVKRQIVVNKQEKKSKKDKFKGSKKRRNRSTVVSESSDSDYLISEDDDDFDVEDQEMEDKQENNRKKEKNVGSNKRSSRNRSTMASKSSDSDYLISEEEDFNVEDQDIVDKQEKNSNKEKNVGSNKRRRNKSSVVSSDSDYLISEDNDEFVMKDQVVVEKQRKKKKATKKKAKPKKTRRQRSLVVSDSESFDFDNVTSEEEARDLQIGLDSKKPKRVVAGKKGEEKGKEKQAYDSWKQVCGICLSEEKKSAIQGLLNCCSHYFCFACIMEWSKVESRCPLCKRRFVTITKSGRSDPGFGIRSAVIKVEERDQVYQPSEEELRGILDPYENVVCMECQQGGDDNLMLLCDNCDSSAHTYCVGLGREVPEGNWYCECCRSVTETIPNQETNSNNLLSSVTESTSTDSPRPRIDLNALPRDFPGEDQFVSSRNSGFGASTLSGRRHIRQRIHIILSTNRQRQRTNSSYDVAENLNSLPSVLSFEQRQRNPRPFFHSQTNLAPCMFREGSSFRHVDGAKEEVQQMVISHLENLSRNRILGCFDFSETAKNATHTILAACGIEHHRSMISPLIELPNNCTHYIDEGSSNLLRGCCSSCFSSFVKNVVQSVINTAR